METDCVKSNGCDDKQVHNLPGPRVAFHVTVLVTVVPFVTVGNPLLKQFQTNVARGLPPLIIQTRRH